MVTHHTRVVLLGGPYDGHVWYPNQGVVTTQWAHERPLVPEVIDPSSIEIGSQPTSGTFDEDDDLIVTGPLGEELYIWSHDDVFEHAGLFMWGTEIVFDGDDPDLIFEPDFA